jgi:hypothetical protein
VPLLAVANNTLPQYVLWKQTGIMKDYTAVVPIGHHQEADALTFLHAMVPGATAIIENELQTEGGVKVSLILEAEVEKFSKNGETITTGPFFLSGSAEPVLHTGEIEGRLHGAVNKIMERLETFTNEGSGWRLSRCVALRLQIAQYQPFRSRSYIKTPAYIPLRTVVNVKNNDNRCFEWAVLSALYPVDPKENQNRTAKYIARRCMLNFTGIDFPVKVTDVAKFERQEPDVSVSVFGWDKCLHPIYVSRQDGQEVDLLLIKDGERSHYVWIKYLARMLFKNSANGRRKHPCRRCLHVFSTPEHLESHKVDCLGIVRSRSGRRCLRKERTS